MNTMTVTICTRTGVTTLNNVPAMFKERNYNPCFDTVLVPDTSHPECPKALVNRLADLIGPMMDGWETIGNDTFRVMSRYEDEATYDMMSR